MQSKMKRWIAFTLAAVMVFGLTPGIVFANEQSGVTNLSIRNVTGRVDGAYSTMLSWTAPIVSNQKANDGTYADNTMPNIHNPLGYRIMGRRTVSGSAPILYEVITPADVTSTTVNIMNPRRGSFYEFSVLPYHTHLTTIDQLSEPKMVVPSDAQVEKVLYMTDIQVNAVGTMVSEGSGESALAYPSFTVTWDAPTYNGTQIFSAYKIYYHEVTASGIPVGGSFEKSQIVYITNNSVKESSDSQDSSIKRLTYTLSKDDYIKQGAKYSIKIEPYNATLSRDYRSITPLNNRTVQINNKDIRIDFKDIKERDYRIDDVGVPFTLYVEEYSDEYLSLSWNQINTGTVSAGGVIVIYSSLDETKWSKVSVIHDTKRTYYLVPRPTEGIKYYKVRVFNSETDANLASDDDDNDSLIVIATDTPYPYYDASLLSITPTDPEFVKPIGVTLNNNNAVLDVKWKPFIREPYRDSEKSSSERDETGTLYYTDTDVEYDFWISDSAEELYDTSLIEPAASGKFTLNTSSKLYNTTFDKYYNSRTMMYEKITTNKLYYIKAVAKKQSSTIINGNKYRYSQASYITVYISLTGAIATPPMISKPPLAIKKDSDNVEMVTDTSVTLEWQYRWSEVLKIDPVNGDKWYSDNVAISGGKLLFGKDADGLADQVKPYQYEKPSDIMSIYGSKVTDTDNPLVARSLDLTNSFFEYKVLLYSDVMSVISTDTEYEAFLKQTTDNEAPGTWQQITTPIAQDEVTGRPYVTITGLTENTPYFILFRAYRIVDEEGTKVAYPTYIITTTLPPGKVVDVKPTVPKLELVEGSQTDLGFTVRWQSSNSLSYVLSYSDIYKDPELGIKMDWSMVEPKIKKYVEDGKEYMSLEIDQLFPDTTYNVWIRAYTATETSAWSNELIAKTNDIPIPKPPQGLGIASQSDIKIINDQQGKNLKPIDYNYMVLEWLKSTKDKKDAITGSVGDTDVTRIEEILIDDVFTVMFGNLIGNKDYYVRGMTITTAVLDEEGKANKVNSYLIQVSDNEDFTSYKQIFVPPFPEKTDDRYYKQKESDFSIPIVIRTRPTSGEYDGEADPEMYPLPQEDFEISYNASSGELVYRFRGNGKDSTGGHDYQVDQRFISKLAAGNYHVYGIDLTFYDNKKINKRTVEMPYSIITAMAQGKIDFKIKADNLTLTIPYGAFDTADFKKTGGLNKNSIVKISMDQSVSNLPKLNASDSYASTAQNISVGVTTASSSSNLAYSAKPLKIAMGVSNRYSTLDSNIGAYYSTPNSNLWSRLDSKNDLSGPVINTESTKLGTFAAIAKKNEVVPMGSNEFALTDSILSVSSIMVFTDISNINQKSNVTANQFNNVMYAVSKNKKELELRNVVSQAEQNALIKSGTGTDKLGNAEITRQEAINALVNLYESKTGKRISGVSDLSTTNFKDIADADAKYQKNLLKAGDIGMLRSGANPKDNLTFGEFMYMIDIIMQDSGM